MVKIYHIYIKPLLKPIKKYGLATVLVFSLLLNSNSYLILAQEATQSAKIEVATENAETLPSVVPTPTNPPAGGPTPTPTLTFTPTPTPNITVFPTVKVVPTAGPPTSLKPTSNKPSLDKLKLLRKNFKASEDVSVNLGGFKLVDIKPTLTGPDGQIFEVETEEKTVDGETILKIKRPRSFRPGKYTITVEDKSGQSVTQDFTWGVLAINTNKSIYTPEEMAKLSMAVLDEEGEIVCDAKLSLEIRKDTSEVSADFTSEVVNLTTEEGTIKVNSECQLHDFTSEPDYEAEYEVGEAGVYQMEFMAETKNGSYTITDSFEVRDTVPFDIERITATRIYPPKPYPVIFKIKANKDFVGEVIETVPASFEIITTSEASAVSSAEPVLGDSTSEVSDEDTKIITWNVDWKKGEAYELSYEFDAPDISPQFYLLGPLTLFTSEVSLAAEGGNSSTSWVIRGEVFAEIRPWQIASDTPAAGTGTVTYTTTRFLTLAKDNLRANEPLLFTVVRETPGNLVGQVGGAHYDLQIIDPDGNPVRESPKITTQNDQTANFQLAPRDLKPGKHTLIYRRPAGTAVVEHRAEFLWGDPQIKIDPQATHHCRLEPFRVDISEAQAVPVLLILDGEKGDREKVETINLPQGIKITFSKSKSFSYFPALDETRLDLEITKQTQSQKGSLSIPIIYTKLSPNESVAVCQLNITNY